MCGEGEGREKEKQKGREGKGRRSLWPSESDHLPLLQQAQGDEVATNGTEEVSEHSKDFGPGETEVLTMANATTGVEQNPVEEQSLWPGE